MKIFSLLVFVASAQLLAESAAADLGLESWLEAQGEPEEVNRPWAGFASWLPSCFGLFSMQP